MGLDFDFSLFEQNTNNHTGSYYVEKLGIQLPIRIYNYIKDMNFSCETNFCKYLENFLENHTSRYLFQSDDICFFYPSIHYQKAQSQTICQISGAPIIASEFYYTYRPLLDNLTSGKVYTISKTIKVSTGYEGILPQNLKEFEQLVSDFSLGLDSNGINFYDFKINAGENALDLKLLSKRKRP